MTTHPVPLPRRPAPDQPGAGRRVLVAHPSAELYGSDRVLLESVLALRSAGWQVHVALSDEGPLRALIEASGATVVRAGVPVVRKALLSPVGLVRFAVDLMRAAVPTVRLLRAVRPDVVYVNTVTVPAWIPLARLTGARVVCHVHEAEDDVPAPVRVALASPLLAAQAVVVNSRASLGVLTRALPMLRRRASVVYNGVPGPGPDQVRPPREQLTGRVRLALVGRISPRKGTDVAVEALQRLVAEGVDAELALAGNVFPGYEWFEQQVREQVERAGLSDRVQWLGMLPEVWGCLADADIALVPSRVEPFGNAAVEALLAQRPVVAGDTQGLREIVTPGVNGLLCLPGDAASLAAAIHQTITDWPAARSAAGPAREAAEQRFGVARYRADIVSTLARLAPRGARPTRRIPFRSKENHR